MTVTQYRDVRELQYVANIICSIKIALFNPWSDHMDSEIYIQIIPQGDSEIA
jgi:hypothetical protein